MNNMLQAVMEKKMDNMQKQMVNVNKVKETRK